MSDQAMTDVEGVSWSIAEIEMTEELPPPVFHHLNKLPREIGDVLWEHVVLQDLKSDTCNFLAVRQCSRALFYESMLTFSKHATFCLNPEKDERWRETGFALSPALASEIQNLEIELSTFRDRRFTLSAGLGLSSFRELLYLKDNCDVLGTLSSHENHLRNKCLMRADFDGDVFCMPYDLIDGLQCLKSFKTVVFEGKWDYPSKRNHNVPAQPFDYFKSELERFLGPATCLIEDPLSPTYEFHPRQFLEMWFQNRSGEPGVGKVDGTSLMALTAQMSQHSLSTTGPSWN